MEKIRLCKHPNILSVHRCFCIRNYMWIVTPFMNKGSLYRILNIVRDSKQTPSVQGLSVNSLQSFHSQENIVCYVMHEVLKGLAYIHSSNFVHLYLLYLHFIAEISKQRIFSSTPTDPSVFPILASSPLPTPPNVTLLLDSSELPAGWLPKWSAEAPSHLP